MHQSWRASHESSLPPGFGLRQSSGAFRWRWCVRKRQRAVAGRRPALQDADAWFLAPMRDLEIVEAAPGRAVRPTLLRRPRGAFVEAGDLEEEGFELLVVIVLG